jgi:RHS repeat-associated protein
VRLVSGRASRTETVDRAFAPYGETYNPYGASTDVNFTGDNQDFVAGTFDTANRELNPTQGRWISPDPAHSGWNGYSYTTNPLGDTDLSGLGKDTWSYCTNTATCNADDGGTGGGGGGSGASQSALAGFGDCNLTFSCQVYTDSNGMQVNSQIAQAVYKMVPG